ncbi:MAG: aspartoacylase [Bacteroidetes bacterium]|nr:MAG: aspartoacylase [Bacteroidota bacterium]
MAQVYSKALKKTISVERIIGKIQGNKERPTLVFFSGIHGNESAGVFALQEFFNHIKSHHKNFKGNIYGVLGNPKALELNQRHVDCDLNRIWTSSNIEALKSKEELNTEEKEQIELHSLLKEILENNKGPFYFIDLHTTSSKTLPFITINDAIINRNFSKLFPVPIVLGIEEYLNGPLLSYINELGYVSLGFESGQHDEQDAITNGIAFIYLSLVFTNILSKSDVKGFNEYYNKLNNASNNVTEIFEVIYLHKIKNDEVFKMKTGFKSFETIKKGELLAISDDKEIVSKYNAKIFMPLYQTKGREGFFIIKKIKPFFLKLSVLLRQFKADNFFVLFPGVSWENREKKALMVNLKTARFMVKPLFHLLGYRNKQVNKTHLKLYNRERVAKVDMYKNERWCQKPLN